MAVLPPNVSQQVFSRALDRFREVVGDEWVFSSDEDVDLYRDAYSPSWGEPGERIPSGAVAPIEVEQVQQIVRIANEFSVPVFPISTGKNLTYGGSAPNMSGTLVLDLKRMNRILEVDERRAFALVEPGVSYFDLYRHIQDRRLKVWIDCPDPGWGSVIGNSLDRGLGYTTWTFRDHFGAHCGMEVVLPNGELMRTGMGAVPGSRSWQDYRYGYGPWVDGLFSQGNFGVVTKMGFWLLPEPDAYLSGIVSVPKRQDLIPLVDVVNYLENSSYIGQPRYRSPLGAVRNEPPLRDLLAGNPFPDDAALDRAAEEMGVPSWSCQLQFYGGTEVVRAAWRQARQKLAEAIPGATFEDEKYYETPMTEEQIANERKVAFGVPNLAIFSIGARSEQNPIPVDGHLDFTCVIPKTGEDFLDASRVFFDAMQGTGVVNSSGQYPFGPFLTPSTWHARNFIIIVGLPTYRTNTEANQKTRAWMSQLIELASANGWGEYRASPTFQDQVMGAYSFNGHALRNFLETLKDAADPNGIISPGRGGVWPDAYRFNRNTEA